MNYQLSSTASNGSFDLIDNKEVLITHFQYENWFSSSGTASFQQDQITIKSRNFWHSAFDVLINGVDKGDITFNWQGHILIRLEEQSGITKNYRLKSKGFWDFRFVLEDEQHMELIQLIPKFRWNKLAYNYGVDFAETFTPAINTDLIALLLACGYGANLYMTMMASAA
ncbi:hypothetical protein [Spirosoma aerolatum]|uniref:hypothetical protein n=1 Tax=Spirosoma aerolatum TaxID=1211326 RepID=UPI0009AE1DD7|nr:hypothetical protein [Spirosoma aerolatum]